MRGSSWPRLCQTIVEQHRSHLCDLEARALGRKENETWVSTYHLAFGSLCYCWGLISPLVNMVPKDPLVLIILCIYSCAVCHPPWKNSKTSGLGSGLWMAIGSQCLGTYQAHWLPGFESQLCCLLGVCSWANYLTSLSLYLHMIFVIVRIMNNNYSKHLPNDCQALC